jgi:hypothetical protein
LHDGLCLGCAEPGRPVLTPPGNCPPSRQLDNVAAPSVLVAIQDPFSVGCIALDGHQWMMDDKRWLIAGFLSIARTLRHGSQARTHMPNATAGWEPWRAPSLETGPGLDDASIANPSSITTTIPIAFVGRSVFFCLVSSRGLGRHRSAADPEDRSPAPRHTTPPRDAQNSAESAQSGEGAPRANADCRTGSWP